MKGHICERSPGRWAIILDVRDPETGKRKRRWHSFAGTKRQAQVESARLISEMQNGTSVDPSNLTVAAYFQHLAGARQTRAAHSRALFRSVAEKPEARTWSGDAYEAKARSNLNGIREAHRERPARWEGRLVASHRPPRTPSAVLRARSGRALEDGRPQSCGVAGEEGPSESSAQDGRDNRRRCNREGDHCGQRSAIADPDPAWLDVRIAARRNHGAAVEAGRLGPIAARGYCQHRADRRWRHSGEGCEVVQGSHSRAA
jgi:hypothetical protein